MKKIIILSVWLLVGLVAHSQPKATPAKPPATAAKTAAAAPQPDVTPAAPDIDQKIKQNFIDGGVPYMVPILLCLIFGLSICIERIIYLNRAQVNRQKLLASIEADVLNNNLESAAKTCQNTRGPLATILYQGIERLPHGLDITEKSIVATGNSQMSLLERGLTWISLFITLAPMLGFFGTVVGMVIAFDQIEQAGDISASLVAGGMKVALITTVGGLIVAMVLQVCYNYIVAKIDSLVHDMEEGAIDFVDIILKSGKYTK